MAAHFTNDLYGHYLPALLPLLADVHGMSLARAGLLVSISTLCGSLFQPALGYLADSARRRTLAPIGLVGAALGSALLGVAPSYLWLVVVTILHGLGSAAFHPQSADSYTCCRVRAKAPAWRPTSWRGRPAKP